MDNNVADELDDLLASLPVVTAEDINQAFTNLRAKNETLLKQATSMMIALRQVSGILWEIHDTLMDEGMRHGRTKIERHGRSLAMEGIDAITGVLKAGALEEKQHCGHERRFIVFDDDSDIDPNRHSDKGKTGYCALCLLEKHEQAVSRAIQRDLALDKPREEIWKEG